MKMPALAANAGRIVVVVDTLSFSTLVAFATIKGAKIYPAGTRDDAAKVSIETGAELAVRRKEVPEKGRYSLSPLTYVEATPDTRVAIFSPNGGMATLCARSAPHVFAGALVNAGAVARRINQLVTDFSAGVTVVACGERVERSGETGDHREAVEDYLGAGAILAGIDLPKSPAAADCARAYLVNRANIRSLLVGSFSGQEFAGTGFFADVEFAARVDLIDSVPELRPGPHPWYAA